MSAIRELASGIDALYLSGQAHLGDSLLADLDRARDQARSSSEAVAYRLGRVSFGLAPHGWGRYPFRLSHEYGLIGFTGSRHLPAIRVQPKAELLHGLGAVATVEAVSDLLSPIGDVDWTVSRIDLFADVQGWSPTVEERNRFVCRATTRVTHEESGELTGLQFGLRKGGGISARIYEKSAQARKVGADWWPDKWGDRYLEGEPVTRIEFEFGRKVLRECRLSSPHETIEQVAGLWGYGTEWLSFRDVSNDLTRSRWPVSAEWEAIRSVSLRDRPITVERISSSRAAADERRIVSGMCGYLSSYAALRDLTGLDEALSAAESVLRQWERETGIPFTDRVKKKRRRRELGL